MSLVDGSIKPVWNCGMAEKCTNPEEPGKHRGDHGYKDCGLCRGELVPEEPRELRDLNPRKRY